MAEVGGAKRIMLSQPERLRHFLWSRSTHFPCFNPGARWPRGVRYQAKSVFTPREPSVYWGRWTRGDPASSVRGEWKAGGPTWPGGSGSHPMNTRAVLVFQQNVPWGPNNRFLNARQQTEWKGTTLIYAIANQKGGVGKTTTAINLAACLAQSGERVLLVDMDSQANASHGLGVRVRRGEPTILEVLLGEQDLVSIITPSSVERLDIVPSSPDMAGAGVLLPSLENREFRLKEALAESRIASSDASSGYSFIFIDCPPSLGLLTVNALVAAEQVIIPVQTEYYALEGLTQLMSTIAAVKARLNPDLRIAGLVLTMMDARTTLARQVEQEIRDHFPRLSFKTVVPRNVRLAEAPSHGVPVSVLDPHCSGSDAYFDLALEVVSHG